MPKYILWAIIAMVLYSVVPILHKKVPDFNSISLLFIYSIIGTVMFGLLLIFDHSTNIKTIIGNNHSLIYAGIVGIIVNLAFLAYVAAIRNAENSTGTVILLRNLANVFAILLAIIILTEKLTPTRIASIILGAAAIFLTFF
jgi:uncharacterized membrane protein